MAKFKGIVKLSHSQYKSLKNNGTITVNGKTITYDPDTTLYVTRGTGDAGGSGLIDTISVDGVNIPADDNKNVNIDLSGKADKTDLDTILNESKSYTETKIANLVNSAPETLDTLGEVAQALKENEDVVEALNSAIGNKADKTELSNYVKVADMDNAVLSSLAYSKVEWTEEEKAKARALLGIRTPRVIITEDL